MTFAVAAGILLTVGCSATVAQPSSPAATAAGGASAPTSAAPASASAAARSVTIAKSAATQPACSHYAGGDCPMIDLVSAGFTGDYTCDFYRSDEKNPWFSDLKLTGDHTGSTGAYFGFDATLHVVCDGVESNHLAW
jgi:hypothetical protein